LQGALRIVGFNLIIAEKMNAVLLHAKKRRRACSPRM
jgi:hypothetical protein